MRNRPWKRLLAYATFFCAASPLFGQSGSPSNITGFDASETLVVGDSIAVAWTEMPHRYGLEGQSACMVRMGLGTAIAQNPGMKRLLIEVGTDDLLQGPGPGLQCLLPNQTPVASVLDMIKTAKLAGLQVFVLSILPISWDDRAGQPAGQYVQPFNTAMQNAIAGTGAIWLDGFDIFNGHPEYQSDGVHPNGTGFHLLDTLYATAICQASQCSATPTTTTLTVNPANAVRPANVTATMQVTGSNGAVAPSGVINLYLGEYNSVLFASAKVDAKGLATLTSSSSLFTPGTYTVYAEYMGDGQHITSFSPLTTITVQ